MFLRLPRWFIIAPLGCLCLFFPTSMAVHADGGAPNRAYVAGVAQGIEIIDISQQKAIGHMAVAGDPHTILLSLDGNYLSTTEPQLHRVAVILAGTGQIFCLATVPGHPTLLAIDSNTNTLFAASNDTSSVTAIDPESCHVKHIFQLGSPVYGLGVALVGTSSSPSSGNQLWVADSTALTVFDESKGTQIQQIPIPEGPRSLSIPPGSAVYVTTQHGSVITVDLNTSKVATLISGGKYGSMDFDENTGKISVPDQKNHQLVVLEPASAGFALPPEPGRTIPLKGTPTSVAITSDGQLAFVALEDGKVAMLDVPAHQITHTFDVGGNPHFIITGLNPPVFSTTPQLAHTLQTVITIATYVTVAVLLVVPLILFRRYVKTRRDDEGAEEDQLSREENRETVNVQPEMGQGEDE